jgi:hypothetical protein
VGSIVNNVCPIIFIGCRFVFDKIQVKK